MIYDKFKAKERSSEVEVIQFHMFSSRSYRKCEEFVGKFWKGITIDFASYDGEIEQPSVLTPLGYIDVNHEDYIIKIREGVFYVCSPNVFKQTYEEIKTM